MTITIIDYDNNKYPIDAGDLNDISEMYISIVSGDEILYATYKDGHKERFDSRGDRSIDYYDGGYTIYDISDGANLLNDREFINRRNSYAFYEERW